MLATVRSQVYKMIFQTASSVSDELFNQLFANPTKKRRNYHACYQRYQPESTSETEL